jgi:hypothetical protein
MTTRLRRGSVSALTAVLALTLATFTLSAAPATASTTVPIHWTVNASTHLKSLDMDVVVPPGTFDGTIDLATGNLTGTLALPPATKKITLFGLPLASATFAITENGPITGHVDLATMKATVTASFNFNIKQASLSILPWLNLVGSTCTGAQPVTVTMSGPVSLTGPSTFSSTYTIPPFKGCGLLITPVLNLIIPGPGNTFSATFAPPAP